MTLVPLPSTVSEIRDYMVNEIKNNIIGPRSGHGVLPDFIKKLQNNAKKCLTSP